ncbi:hypothetical protein ZWY2020_009769 [Hordeum vulgare]|nr:hypothetical protein ZWY2020_009769 [Hordeum vulgare]
MEKSRKKMCLRMCVEVHLDEGLVAEILARLPAKFVLRSRGVCKEWLRIIDSPAFLAAHARHRPLELLLYTRTKLPGGLQAAFDIELDAVTVSARRPVARYPSSLVGGRNQYCSLLASCDGLLLLRNNSSWQKNRQRYLICNPATRRWSDLPRLSRDAEAEQQYGAAVQSDSGFYFHVPSGEYRLLCRIAHGCTGRAPYYCVFSAGADEPRRLSVQATYIAEQPVIAFDQAGLDLAGNRCFLHLMTPAVLHGHLHWLEHMEAGLTDQMVAFDTVSETFRRMPPPPLTCEKKNSHLLVADGSLMASEPGHLFVDLWVLEGYGGGAAAEGTWEHRHRVEVCWSVERPLLVAGGDGGDVVLGHNSGVVAYNLRSRTVRQVVGGDASTGDTHLLPSRHVFRESLVRHGFFEARPHPGLPLLLFS